MKQEPIYDWMDYAAKKLQRRLLPDIDIDDWMWGEKCFQFVLILNASSRERAVTTDPYRFSYDDRGLDVIPKTPYEQIDEWIEDRLYRFLKEESKMTRVEQDVLECTNTETGEFDWDMFQHLCDIAEEWDMEE